MPQYKLEGNYGTIGVSKEVWAADEDSAYEQTGIIMDLEAAGWTVEDGGEYGDAEWEVTEVEGAVAGAPVPDHVLCECTPYSADECTVPGHYARMMGETSS